MDCNILSNPPVDDLIWLFNGQQLTTNVSAGIIISNQSLVLQRVRVEHCGQYQCLAQNAMGKSESNKLDLKPKCKCFIFLYQLPQLTYSTRYTLTY